MNAGKTSKALLGLGSNVKPEKYIPLAVEQLKRHLDVLAVSDFYRSPPVGGEGTAEFINGCILIETSLPPRVLKYDVLRMIESRLDRLRIPDDKNAPRTIDIDILLYGDAIFREQGIEIPNPELLTRNFLLIPAQQIAGEMIYPPEGKALKSYTLSPEGMTFQSFLFSKGRESS